MASQRIAIAKIGGSASRTIHSLLRELASARNAADDREWSSDQWPPRERARIDRFAEQLRAHAYSLPVVYYTEWSDYWSMGDVFHHSLTPQGGMSPLVLLGYSIEVFAYPLPDQDSLARHLDELGKQQFEEYDWFKTRLLEAVRSWEGLVEESILVVIREVFGGLVTDEELLNAMNQEHAWIFQIQHEAQG